MILKPSKYKMTRINDGREETGWILCSQYAVIHDSFWAQNQIKKGFSVVLQYDNDSKFWMTLQVNEDPVRDNGKILFKTKKADYYLMEVNNED